MDVRTRPEIFVKVAFTKNLGRDKNVSKNGPRRASTGVDQDVDQENVRMVDVDQENIEMVYVDQ